MVNFELANMKLWFLIRIPLKLLIFVLREGYRISIPYFLFMEVSQKSLDDLWI